MPASSQLQNLFAVEVTAVGDDIELVHVERCFRLLGDVGELRPIRSLIGYLMRHDQMMLRLDGNLDVVAHNTRATSAVVIVCMTGPSESWGP